jgi:flagellum-specific peptidoglycan hydrolase FlgJ
MTDKEKLFIEKMHKAVAKYAPDYGIKVYSPIIAQAILESKWGESKLSKEHNNFFGLKAGRGYKGDVATYKTNEEINGKTKTISDNFRAYKNFDEGVKGYFDFINTKRYANLKGVTDPKTYLENIKNDGYATASNYVFCLMAVIVGYKLTIYDPTTTAATNKKAVDFDDSIKKCFDMIAGDVIKHPELYGVAEVRKERLYKEIQIRINRMMAKR